MKIKNLENFPMQLGDNRMIGASGTSGDEREYDLPKLSERDKQRVEREVLEIVKELPAVETEPAKTNKLEVARELPVVEAEPAKINKVEVKPEVKNNAK